MSTDNDTETEGEIVGDELIADIGETRIPMENLSIHMQNKRKANNGFKTEFMVCKLLIMET